MDYEHLASELIRELRGKRSQNGLSRRLRYRSNVVHTWESGAGYPTAAKFLFVARRVGVDPNQAVARFYRREPAWVTDTDVATREGVVRLLQDLRGQTPILDLAERTDRSRFAVSRWLKGETEPRLPDFLRLVRACSLRLVDFLAELVNPARVSEIRTEWETLQAARRAAYESPWSHAVLRVLELDQYQSRGAHTPGWIADQLGIDHAEEERCIDLHARTGQIRFEDGRWREDQVRTVDTRQDPAAARQLAHFWAHIGAQRLQEHRGNFAYNVFGVSTADLERLRELQRNYFAQLRAIVAESEPVEHVMLANMQLCELDGAEHKSEP